MPTQHGVAHDDALSTLRSSLMTHRCNGCGRSDVATEIFRCTWPDGRITVERHCISCQRTWHRQLLTLGAEIEIAPDDPGATLD